MYYGSDKNSNKGEMIIAEWKNNFLNGDVTFDDAERKHVGRFKNGLAEGNFNTYDKNDNFYLQPKTK